MNTSINGEDKQSSSLQEYSNMREENALGQSGSPSRLSNKVQRPSTPDVLKDDKNEGIYIM